MELVRSFVTQAVNQDDARLRMMPRSASPARTLATSSWSLRQEQAEEQAVVEEFVTELAPQGSVRSLTWPTDAPAAPTQSILSLTTLEDRESEHASQNASQPVRSADALLPTQMASALSAATQEPSSETLTLPPEQEDASLVTRPVTPVRPSWSETDASPARTWAQPAPSPF